MFMFLQLVLKKTTAALFIRAFFVGSPVLAQTSPVKLAMIEGLSGGNANGGEAVFRNLVWAIERVNQRANQPTGACPLSLTRHDSKGQVEEALTALRAAIDDGAQIILQDNSSAVAAALIDAINKHNEREPLKRVLCLNYSAVDPVLTNEKCGFWHFRFDAHADMRMSALMSVLKDDPVVKSVYLTGQDYSFGQTVLREARRQLGVVRPDVQIKGDELHPLLRVKDFAPYAVKIKASGADAVITGNFSNDLTLLVKAAKDVGFDGKFYTFYGNALGAPAAIGEAGVGKVIAMADWLPNVQTRQSEAFYQAFRQRYSKSEDDYVHMRMHLMMQALTQAIDSSSGASRDTPLDVVAVARALEKTSVSFHGQTGGMRASDHLFQQPLVVGLMGKSGTNGIKFDVEGSGYGFRVVKTLSAAQAGQPTTCSMARSLPAVKPGYN